jgi:hypothetical protein
MLNRFPAHGHDVRVLIEPHRQLLA